MARPSALLSRLPPATERALLVGAVLLLFGSGYYATGLRVDPDRALRPASPLDDRIPFVPEAVFVYALAYTAAFFPAFVVRDRRLFRRTAVAYTLAILVSIVCFALVPVTAEGLRPETESLDATRFSGWGTRVLFTLDPPANLLPSLHVAFVFLAAWSAGRAWPAVGRGAGLAGLAIAASTLLVKQHYAVDVLAGMALAAGIAALCLREQALDPSPPIRGLARFAALVAGIYAAFGAAFLAGVPAPG